jgi:hypothetical protein
LPPAVTLAVALTVRLFALFAAALRLLRPLILALLILGLFAVHLIAVLLRPAIRVVLIPVKLILAFLIHHNLSHCCQGRMGSKGCAAPGCG